LDFIDGGTENDRKTRFENVQNQKDDWVAVFKLNNRKLEFQKNFELIDA
jgi:hypothetical protein